MMEKAEIENKEYQKLYPKLPEVSDALSTESEDLDENAGEEFMIQRNSRHSPRTPSPIRSSVTNTPIRNTHSSDPQRSTNWLNYIWVFLIVPCVIAYKLYIPPDTRVTSPKEWKHIVAKLHPHLMEKRNKFPAQNDDLWFQIISGLKMLSKDPKSPAVYLLTYDENSIHPSSCIVEIITTAANNFILDKSGWSLLNGTQLIESQVHDPGILIEKIASTLEKHKIIVVTDVQNIPAQLAQGFHFLVDEDNPKIREAVYVLTLKIPSHLKNSKPVEASEVTLKESWKNLKDNVLLPLVTRITIRVLPVMAENSETSCPLISSVTTEVFL